MAHVIKLAPVLAVVASLACGSDPGPEPGFTSSPVLTTTLPASSSTGAQSSSSSGDGGSGGSSTSGTSTGEDSTASASSTSTPGIPDAGPIPDFGTDPQGCQGKIDFLFVISSNKDMDMYQAQLNEVFPHFIDKVESDFADFDYHIMVVDTSVPYLPECDFCYMCQNCMLPGCGDIGGPEDYPCDLEKVECDVTQGAGVTFIGNWKGSNTRCELAGGNRYITKDEGENLANAFKCISTIGTKPDVSAAMDKMVAAVQPDMLGKYGCNAYFVRPDALLVVVIMQRMQDTVSWGTPTSWYKALKDAKKGDKDAIVVLAISGDHDRPEGLCKPYVGGDNPIRLLAEEADHGLYGSICSPSYVPLLDAATEVILDQCALLIPQ